VTERAGGPEAEVAIIGMAGRFPGARRLDRFWRNLREGVTSISFFSAEELREAGVDAATVDDPSYVRASPVLHDVDRFDAAFFGYTPREARFIDPQQRILLECAWEAMEDAGYAGNGHPYPVGVFAGSSLNTYLLYSGLLTQLQKEFVLTLSSSDKDFLATRIAYKLNLQGPALTVQSACSTSLVAVHVACQSLLSGECDLALAGGVCVKVPHRAGYFWQPGGMVSRDGHVRAFDARASGTVFGSGAGIVLLKRLSDAVCDGDSIYAVVKGSAVNNDGAAKASFSAPSVDKQAEVIVEALARAGITAGTVSYVEAHGTGTPIGDPIEIAALTKAFRSDTQERGFCAIGSVKPNIGHLEAASGIVGLIKTVLALQHETIPPTVGFEEPNPAIDFAHSPFFVNRTPLLWVRGGAPRRAGISSLGVGGTNVHVIVEEPPATEASGWARPFQVVPVSARTRAALQASEKRLAESLEQDPAAAIADVAFTLQVGRGQFEYRDFAVCDSSQGAARRIAGLRPRDAPRSRERRRDPVFFFPAGEALAGGALAELYDSERLFRRGVEQCREVPLAGATGPLMETFVVQYALARLWISWGVRPGAIIGDGVGELVAACVAGACSLEESLRGVAAPAGSAAGAGAGPGTSARCREAIEALSGQEARVFLELGPGRELRGLLAQLGSGPDTSPVALGSLPEVDRPGRSLEHVLTILGTLWVAGVEVDWHGLHDGERRHRVPLPTYPFQRQSYWWEAAASRD